MIHLVEDMLTMFCAEKLTSGLLLFLFVIFGNLDAKLSLHSLAVVLLYSQACLQGLVLRKT